MAAGGGASGFEAVVFFGSRACPPRDGARLFTRRRGAARGRPGLSANTDCQHDVMMRSQSPRHRRCWCSAHTRRSLRAAGRTASGGRALPLMANGVPLLHHGGAGACDPLRSRALVPRRMLHVRETCEHYGTSGMLIDLRQRWFYGDVLFIVDRGCDCAGAGIWLARRWRSSENQRRSVAGVRAATCS